MRRPPSFPPWLLLSLAVSGFASVLACGESAPPPVVAPGGPVAGWPEYGGDAGGTRYSPLRQIDRDNVHLLEPAWHYRTGDYPGGRLTDPPAGLETVQKTSFQATPILDEGTLYFCSGLNRVFAVDAETGAERWIHDAQPRIAPQAWSATCRGVALWRSAEATGACAKRIFMGTMDARLVALDAASGAPCTDFGEGGAVDLRAGLGDVLPGEVYVTSPPTVVGNVVAVGSLIGDNRRVDPPGGVVRAFDVRNGDLRWAFDPVPPGTPPLPPAEDGTPRFHRGTPNAWSIFSVDRERDLVFVPLGNPSPDYYGGLRDGRDFYGSSVVALEGATGRVVWHYQTVHHDLWDYDVASQPTLLDVEVQGVRRPAVAQATKPGHLFLLDRFTGVPLFPVRERAVPPSDADGEEAAITQPFPTFPRPLHPARLEPDDAFGLTPLDRRACRRRIQKLRNNGIFTPPSLEGSVHYPGSPGGANWGGVAIDPKRRLLVLNQNRIAQSETLIPVADMPDLDPQQTPQGLMAQEGAPYRVVQRVITSPLGIPCSPPPWGTLLAIDLDSGEKAWEVPFGTTEDILSPLLAQPNFREWPLLGWLGGALSSVAPWITPEIEWGFPSMGGPIATASGLVFIGAAMDDYLRAYDIETGEELWRVRLPAGGQATPMTYRLREGGRQFVVIAAGGHGTLGTRPGDWLLAYALPEALLAAP